MAFVHLSYVQEDGRTLDTDAAMAALLAEAEAAEAPLTKEEAQSKVRSRALRFRDSIA